MGVTEILTACFRLSIVGLTLNLVAVCLSFDFDGSSESYAKFSSWVPCHNGTMSFEFKTAQANALLLYTDSGNKVLSDDYFEIKLVNGVLQSYLKLNGGRAIIQSVKNNLNDNEYHKVDLIRDSRFTTLTVDGAATTVEDKGFDSRHVTFGDSTESYVYIGGLPMQFNERLEKLAHTQSNLEPRLHGSVRNLFFSNCGKALVHPQLISSEGLVTDGDKCLEHNPCQNNGVCVMKDNGVFCDCSMTDFEGTKCQTEKKPIEAMFKGREYLTYDLTMRSEPIFSQNDDLDIHFKTTEADGLIFYTGYDFDYLTVFLKNGDIHVVMGLGGGSFNGVADMNGYSLDDGQWHHLKVTRNSRRVEVHIDGQMRATGSTTGDFNSLSSSLLYLGGSPKTYQLRGSDIGTNFKGCMKAVTFEADSVKLKVIELGFSDHNLITAMGDITYGQCETVIDSQPITFTTPDSFIALPRWDVRKSSGTIEFQFRTTEHNGLIMYNSGTYGSSNLDFFAMEIIDGNFYLVMELGTGTIKEKVSRTPVDDGVPHLVYFKYKGKTGLIKVDNHEIEYVTPGMALDLDIEDLLFIGGLDFDRYNAYRLPKELWAGILKKGFVGCFQDLVINNERVDLMTVAHKQQQQAIKGECRQGESQCLSQPCLHRGVCNEGWNRYICDCRNTSYRGQNCEHAATTLTFDKPQYVLVTLPKETYTESADISLRFRTIRANGLLLMTESSLTSDAIELFLESGACRLTISLGQRSKTLSIGHNLNDDDWHTAFIKRRGQKVEFWVDTSSPVIATVAQIAMTMRVKRIVLGYMGPFMNGARGSLSTMSDGYLNEAPVRDHDYFIGDMQQFIYNGNHFFDMANKDNIENIDVTARFDSGDSVNKDAVTFESQESYVTLPDALLKSRSHHISMSFKFKTNQATGLIMYSGKGADFLALELDAGFLYYVYDMGGGVKKIQVNTPDPLNDNKWHDVSLFRPVMDEQQIRIDNNPATVEDMRGYSARHFDLKGPLYVGGLLKTSYFSLRRVASRNGFLGCIAALDINGKSVNILEVANYIEKSVKQGCSGSVVRCHANSCLNSGVCEKQWNAYVCNCDMTTYTGPMCGQRSVTYQIGLDKGLIIFEYPERERPSTTTDYIAIGLTTLVDETLVLRIDSVGTEDYIDMEIMGGNIYMVYNMGKESIPIVTLKQKVNDGKYHKVKFVRQGADAILQVDFEKNSQHPIETLRLLYPDLNVTGHTMRVFNNQSRIMVGGRRASNGEIIQEFQGTVSGLVVNGLRILDMLKDGDPRVRAEGDVTLVQTEEKPPERVEILGKDDVQSTQGVKVTKESNNDDIIYSGAGPDDCYSDDEDDCIPVTDDAEDDIITPTMVITRMPTPKPDNRHKNGDDDHVNCKDCGPLGTELLPHDNTTRNYVGAVTVNPTEVDHSTGPETAKATDSGRTLNIFLFVGIGAGVLVAFTILAIALYKFRSREEGSYRVDESQNFAYLEAKKQQSTNGSAVTNVGNGKTSSGKKRDVKEWYV